MTNKEIALCNGIIHTASVSAAAVGAGMAQVPGSDNLVLTPIQLAMTISLGEVFKINLDKSTAGAMLASESASKIGRTISQILVGWIPGAGNVINASTAASLTEAIGWILAREFERQRDRT